MRPPEHEVFAIRYGHHSRKAVENFVHAPADQDSDMPMDYFVWLIRSPDGCHVVVDTGFDPNVAAIRGRQMIRSPVEGLSRLGVSAQQVKDVVLTHLHYDHAGNTGQFPNARFWLQEREISFCTGRYMTHSFFRLAYEPTEVAAMVGKLFDGRIQFVDGDVDLMPGVSLHWVGGHTGGLQVVRVHTAAGWLVLASDLFHYYANRENTNPFPIIFRPEETLTAFKRVASLADRECLIIPGHDPLVGQRFAPAPEDPEFTVRLWQPLIDSQG